MCRRLALSLFAPLAALVACGDLSDAATAIAYDIESQAKRLGSTGGTIVHSPSQWRSGCKNHYRVQFSRAAALVVWCRGSDGIETVSSHATSYHLRFVDVPETIILDKGPGEPLLIEVAATAQGKPVVRSVL